MSLNGDLSNIVKGASGKINVSSIDFDGQTAVTIDAISGGVSIDGTDDSNLTVTGSNKDLDIAVAGGSTQELRIASAGTGANALSIDATAGSMVIGPSLADGQTLKLGKNGATEMIFTPHGTVGSEKISLTNTSGDAADAIKLLSSAGGVTIDAGGGTVTFADNGASLGTITSSGYSGAAASATIATKVTVGDSNADTNFPVVFHNESNALLDDTASFTYNPSTGTLTTANIYNTALKIGRDSGGDWIDFGTDDNIKVHLNNVEEFRFASGGDFHADNDITSFSTTVASDKRLKTNIKDMTYGLENVLQLRGVEFDWKDKRDGKHDIGFIAQEVQDIIPEVINEIPDLQDENNKYLGVDYSKIVPLLVESIKEQQKQIEDLRNEVELLKK